MPPPIWPAPTTRTCPKRTGGGYSGSLSPRCFKGSRRNRHVRSQTPDRSEKSDFDQERVALAPAGADRREPEAAAVSPQLVHHRPEDAGPRSADRMAEGHRPAVHVHLFLAGAEHLRRVQNDRRERLVQLHALDVV